MASDLDTHDDERGLSTVTVRVNVFGLSCEMCAQRFTPGTYGHLLTLGPADGQEKGLGLLLICGRCYLRATAERVV